MSYNSKAKKIIPALYLRGPIEAITFGYIMAKKQESSKDLNEIAIDLQSTFGWTEDDYPLTTILMTYRRMSELMKSERISINQILINGCS